MMIANIAPARRMPRGLGHLTYRVPEELAETIQPGQLVMVPLRKSTVYGLVFSVETVDTSEVEMKDVVSIVQEIPLLSTIQRKLIVSIGKTYGISFGSATKLFLPPLQKRKLTKVELSPISLELHNTAKETSFVYKKKNDPFYTGDDTKKKLIIVPDIQSIEAIKETLPEERTAVWHSSLSEKEKFATWFAIRNGEIDTIVGSRSSLFLPYPALDQIVIQNEHDEQHKHWEQSPRYHVHDIVPVLAKLHGSELIYTSYSPRFETYFNIAKGNISTAETTLDLVHAPIPGFQFVNMSDERKGGNQEILGEKVLNHIKDTTGNVILYVNRKGHSPVAKCNSCSFTARCEHCSMAEMYYQKKNALICHYCKNSKPLPKICPKCEKDEVSLYGVGTEQVAEYISAHINQEATQIIRVDGDKNDLEKIEQDQRIIYVGTESVFHQTDVSLVDTIVFVHIDMEIAYPDYRSAELVWHKLKTVRYKAEDEAKIFIQTFEPNQLVLKSLVEPERIYRSELSSRKAFKFPPYSKLVRLTFGGASSYAAERESERVHSLLSRRLTEHDISGTVTYPLATSPTFYRGRNWYTILLKLEPTNWQKDLQVIIALLPSTWRIDPSPQSLLSP